MSRRPPSAGVISPHASAVVTAFIQPPAPRAGGRGTISSLIKLLSRRCVFRVYIYKIWRCVNSNRASAAHDPSQIRPTPPGSPQDSPRYSQSESALGPVCGRGGGDAPENRLIGDAVIGISDPRRSAPTALTLSNPRFHREEKNTPANWVTQELRTETEKSAPIARLFRAESSRLRVGDIKCSDRKNTKTIKSCGKTNSFYTIMFWLTA